MRLLGMQVFPKRKTDDEYVDSVRKAVSRSRWFAVIPAVVALFCLAMYWVIWRMLCSADFPFQRFDLRSPVGEGLAKSGFHVGVMIGAFAGVALVFALLNIVSAIQCFSGTRTARLLLKFHDELKRKERSPASESNTTSG